MSFGATLYNCSDDPRKVGKTLGSPTTVSSIIPTESCDLLSPTFILSYEAAYTTCNYIVVDAPFNRSYFITDMKIDIGKKIVITCEVDPLETYKDAIKNITTTIYRNEAYENSSPYLPDTEYQVKSNFQYFWDPFQTTNNWWSKNGTYVLSWVGNPKIEERYVRIFSEPADWETNWGDYYFIDYTPYADYYPLINIWAVEAPDFGEAEDYLLENYQSGIYMRVGEGGEGE